MYIHEHTFFPFLVGLTESRALVWKTCLTDCLTRGSVASCMATMWQAPCSTLRALVNILMERIQDSMVYCVGVHHEGQCIQYAIQYKVPVVQSTCTCTNVYIHVLVSECLAFSVNGSEPTALRYM